MADKKGNSTKLMKSDIEPESDCSNIFQDFPEDVIHYNFFAALRLLEKQNGQRFGKSKTPKEDPLLLGQMPHLGFPATTLANINILEKTKHKNLNVFFFGLFGSKGPMPQHITEKLVTTGFSKTDKKEKKTQDEFYNIFHHRLISLFYRAWANKEPTTQLDIKKDDRFQFYINSLAGYGLPSLRNRDNLNDYAKAHFSAYLGGKIRHSEGLKNIIFQLYGIQSKIVEFVGEWLVIDKEHQCHLQPSFYAKKLGINTSLGGNSWQSQYKFQIQLGPLSLNQYEACLPGKKNIKHINDAIKNYMRDELQWEIVLLLKKTEIPKTKLGTYGQLGWTSWLKTNQNVRTDTLNEYVGDIHLHCEQIN